jgi:cysteinyl-tRNA synthetase
MYKDMKIYNSLTRSLEEFVPMNAGEVGMYTCGPTVYSFVTIGNWRTYTLGDLLVRALRYQGLNVKYVMNITDVGHLTGDNSGDADTGEDRLEKAAKKEGRNAWEIAKFYEDDFLKGYEALGLVKPMTFCRATEHIEEQIRMVKAIEDKGFAYKIDDGIYFDTLAFEKAGNIYGELSSLSQIKEGARVEPNLQKKDPRDFALWKFSPTDAKRDMEWESPWGTGFPGWHIECSAMSTKYLGDQFDIHLGGEDLRSTHHPNEIAQAEAATGKKPFVKYWMHGAFLLVDGGRMGKSLGNAYTLADLVERGYSPLDLRYFYLTGHYRKQLNFTFDSLDSAKMARRNLLNQVAGYKEAKNRNDLQEEKLAKINTYRDRFLEAINNDLNMPEALAVVFEMIKSNIADYDKYDLMLEWDKVLGLGVDGYRATKKNVSFEDLPTKVKELMSQRQEAREQKDFALSDKIRDELSALGYIVEDFASGQQIRQKLD